ncbi:hypothetical protein RUND412_010309, partial [Rhizina undulata]
MPFDRDTNGKVTENDVRLIPAGSMSQTNGAGSSRAPFQFKQLNVLPKPEPVPVSSPALAVNTIPTGPSEMKSQSGLNNSTECFDCALAALPNSRLLALDTVASAREGNASQRKSAAANNSDSEVDAQISHVGVAQQERPGVPHSPAAQGGDVEAPHFTIQHAENLNNVPCPHAENNEGFHFTLSSTQSTVGNVAGGSITNSHSARRQASHCSHVHSLPANVEGYLVARPNPGAEAPSLAQPEGVHNVQPLNRPAKRLLPAQLAA